MDNLEHNLKLIKDHRIFCFFHGKKAMIKAIYAKQFGKALDYKHISTFNEIINVRKLSKNPLYSKCADKKSVQAYVEKKIGKDYLIPQYLYKKNISINDLESLPNAFVLKTTSGSGFNIVIKDKSKVDLKNICEKMNSYVKIKYGYLWGEFYYNQINNHIISEKLLTENEVYDYKIHCFRDNKNNLRQIIEVLWGPKSNRHKCMYDTNWQPLKYYFSIPPSKHTFKKPKQLSKLLELSDKLSEDFNYVRVDFYIINEKIYFGELTFVPAAGFGKFNPPKYDQIWGSWISQD